MPRTNDRKPQSKPDDLVKSGETELTEEELKKATGGLVIDGVAGESTDAKHKG